MRTSIPAIVALALAACGGGSPSAPAPAPSTFTVTTRPGAGGQPLFSPPVFDLAVGGTVTWRVASTSPFPHNVTSPTNAWAASGDLEASESFQVTFQQAGTFDFLCTLHPGMSGTVTVR